MIFTFTLERKLSLLFIKKTSERTIINYVCFPIAISHKISIPKINQINNTEMPHFMLIAVHFSWPLQESGDLSVDKSLLVELC